MPLRDFLPFRSRENQQFLNWPSAPDVKPIRAKADGVISALTSSLKEQREGEYPPTLIIAIGKTGDQALALLMEKVLQDQTNRSASIRALLLTESPTTLSAAIGRQIRVIELQKTGMSYVTKGAMQSARASSNALFQQVINYKRYQEWLQENLLDLGSDVQVYFIGSLAESAIGMIGDALQILRNFPQNLGRTGLFSRVSAILSLRASTASSLPPDEIFAACREISRMTFTGPHRMNTSFGQSLVVESALLDYLFILDGSMPQTLEQHQEVDVAQLLAESLFTFLHPSARFLWENLINDLRSSGEIRQEAHQPVIHGAGTATLYIPLNEIKRYISVRLAYAVLYGEQKGLSEGLVKKSSPQTEPSLRGLARQFLLNGPFTHPVFLWLLEANSRNYFEAIPDLSPKFISLFQAQVSHSLTHYLNQIPADLGHAKMALAWLDGHLSGCEKWLNDGNLSRPNVPERSNFQYLLFKWRETIQFLSADLGAWEKSLFSLNENESTLPSPTLNWRNANPESSNWRESSGAKTEDLPSGISAILKSQRAEAEIAISDSSADRIYRSVLAQSNQDINELEKYYTDTVRPELSKIGMEASTSFNRIRQRLEWWIHISPDRLPQLYLICWPASVTPAMTPPADVCFKADQALTFSTALTQLAYSQTESLESDLTTNWFGRRIKLLADFLRRAEDAYIRYDQNAAARFKNAATRRSYLISHDPLLSRDLVNDIFPNTPRFDINELGGGQRTRVTAFTLRLNMPLSVITLLQEFQRNYIEKQPETIHLYDQERAATIYEKRLWKLNRVRISLSPEMTILLAEPQLVTLFFQALFTGVIHTAHDEAGRQPYWIVNGVQEFSPLSLAPVGKDGLLLALRRFALELPNASDINQNPQNHFSSSRRLNYISALTNLVKEAAFKPEARTLRNSLMEEFAEWKARGELDRLANSFHTVIICELDEPVWTGW